MKDTQALSFHSPLFEGELLCYAHKYLQQSYSSASIEILFPLKRDDSVPLGRHSIAARAQ